MADSTTDNPWHARYEQERERVLAALGKMTTGGVVETIQHVGSTSVPGLASSGCVDLALAVWPFPLEAPLEAALAGLGYARLPGDESAPERRYRHAEGVQLLVCEAGTPACSNAVLLRDYLRNVADGRAAWADFLRAAGEAEAAKAAFIDGMLVQARAWWVAHHGFGPVEAVATALAGFCGQWLVAGGWSLDLALGSVTRVHHDVDIVVARSDQMALQAHLLEHGWALVTPLDGRLEPWPRHMTLELPRHQVHALREDAFIDFLLTDLSGGVWHYRRGPAVVRTLDKACRRTEAGVPYLAPELALLFKSKNTGNRPRPQDQADFERICAHLDAEQRAWLRWALAAVDPGHAWIEALA